MPFKHFVKKILKFCGFSLGESAEVFTVLVVNGIVPYFAQVRGETAVFFMKYSNKVNEKKDGTQF